MTSGRRFIQYLQNWWARQDSNLVTSDEVTCRVIQ